MQQPLHNKSSLDAFFNDNLKYGKAQNKMILPSSFLLFSEGSESIVLGILLPIFVTEWGITDSQKSALITGVYLGVSIGSFFQTFADKYGRQRTMTASGILQVICNLWSCVVEDYMLFLALRVGFGIGLGIIGPLSVTYITEITPSDMRGSLIILSRVFWSSGMIFTCLVSYFCEERWRVILFIISLPSVLGLYLQMKIGRESPRYLLFNNKPHEAKEILGEMSRLNGKQPLSEGQFEAVVAWAQNNKQHQQVETSYRQLFSGDNLSKTLKFNYLWFAVNLIYYGGMLLLPLILDNVSKSSKSNYVVILISSIFEVIMMFCAKLLMDSPKLGRRKTIMLGFLGASLMSFLLMFRLSKGLFAFCFILMRLCGGMCFITLYPYTAESYHTLVRSKILGIGSMVGRFGVIFIGWAGVYALNILGGSLLFLIFLAVSVSSLAVMTTLSWETLSVDLDVVPH